MMMKGLQSLSIIPLSRLTPHADEITTENWRGF